MGGGVLCMYVFCNTPPTCNHHLQLGLCWAFTMHKSQGQTLDKTVIDLGPKEACTGLTFVCLSRAKRLVDHNLNTELTEMGVFSAVAGNQLPNQLQKRVLPALFHLRCPSESHQRSARGRTRLTTVTSISCRSF